METIEKNRIELETAMNRKLNREEKDIFSFAFHSGFLEGSENAKRVVDSVFSEYMKNRE